MCFTVCADYTGTVDREYNVKLLQTDIVQSLVVCTLQE